MTEPGTEVDYARMARRQAHLSLELSSTRLPRLAEASQAVTAVTLELDFELDDQRRCRVVGQANAELALECQRCLLPVTQAVSTPVDVIVVADDVAARQAGKRMDVFVADGERIDVAALVEDDLLLSLPVDRCQKDECPNAPTLSYPPTEQEVAGVVAATDSTDEPEPSPFAVLEALRNDRGGSEGSD